VDAVRASLPTEENPVSDPLASLDATAQAELVRAGEAQPSELVESAIRRLERLNPELNAVITPLLEKARAQVASAELPAGPFRGVPFLLKDLVLQTRGDPHHAGTRFLKELGWVSDHDTHLAEKLRAAGFVFLGKTNVPELGPLPTTEPEAYGPTRNPWALDHSPGGSSGGSAAAVAAGIVPAAHANDGGGSIRIPASACGLVGLKPTRGRTSLGPDLGEYWAGAVVEHVVTRSVRDTAGILDAVSGPMPGDPYWAPPPERPFREEVGAPPGRLRIGLAAKALHPHVSTHADCVTAAGECARLLESLGHRVEESHPAALEDPELYANAGRISVAGVARDLDTWAAKIGRPLRAEDVEAYTWLLGEIGHKLTATQYLESVEAVHATARRAAAWWGEGWDLLLTPTLSEPPPRLGSFRSTPDDPLAPGRRALGLCTFTLPLNFTGQPAISLPLHWNDAGLPIGIQLVAAVGREDLLLRVAAQLEQERPWRDRWPPVCA
jgi:amidase